MDFVLLAFHYLNCWLVASNSVVVMLKCQVIRRADYEKLWYLHPVYDMTTDSTSTVTMTRDVILVTYMASPASISPLIFPICGTSKLCGASIGTNTGS